MVFNKAERMRGEGKACWSHAPMLNWARAFTHLSTTPDVIVLPPFRVYGLQTGPGVDKAPYPPSQTAAGP